MMVDPSGHVAVWNWIKDTVTTICNKVQTAVQVVVEVVTDFFADVRIAVDDFFGNVLEFMQTDAGQFVTALLVAPIVMLVTLIEQDTLSHFTWVPEATAELFGLFGAVFGLIGNGLQKLFAEDGWFIQVIDFFKEQIHGQQKIEVTGVSLNIASTSIQVGSTVQLSATISPPNASNKGVTWNSSNTGVATVSSLGKVTGIGTGNATITVTTDDRGETATCAVTVTQAPTLPVTGIAITGGATTLNAGATTQWSASIAPTNASNKTIVWNYSNVCKGSCPVPCNNAHGPGATVNQSGLVTAISPGTAVRVTATAHNGIQGGRSVQVRALTNAANDVERVTNNTMSTTAKVLLLSRDFDWANESDAAKRQEMADIFGLFVLALGIQNNPPILDIGPHGGLGSYNSGEHRMKINEARLNDPVIQYILLHEMRHAYQKIARDSAGPNGWGSVTSTTIAWWQSAFARNSTDDGFEAYVSNPREWDARQFTQDPAAMHKILDNNTRVVTPTYFGQWFVTFPFWGHAKGKSRELNQQRQQKLRRY